MGLKESMINRLNAAALRNTTKSVHTVKGQIGEVVKTNIFKGTITVNLNIKGETVLPGKDIALLDELIPQ